MIIKDCGVEYTLYPPFNLCRRRTENWTAVSPYGKDQPAHELSEQTAQSRSSMAEPEGSSPAAEVQILFWVLCSELCREILAQLLECGDVCRLGILR